MASSPVNPAAIILTGGESRRMGTDKASLVVDGASMLDRVRAALEQAGVSTIVVAGPGELPDPESGTPDFRPQGPLSGIASAWTHLRDAAVDPVVVLSCDLPSLTPGVITDLLQASANHTHGALAHDGERPQPLIAAYRPVALDALHEAYEQGERSVRRCFDGWDLGIVNFDPQVLTDADRPEDLQGFTVQWPKNSNAFLN